MELSYPDEDIKSWCVSCGHGMEWSRERYEKQGNYCDTCNSRARKVVMTYTEKEDAIPKHYQDILSKYFHHE